MMISMNSKIKYDLVLKNGNVVLPEGIQKIDIGIINESISILVIYQNADTKFCYRLFRSTCFAWSY
jgi:hypothetical protein